MGKINQGILGGVSGTVGTVIGSTWKGVSYIRAKAKSFNDANTDAQKSTRKTFRKLIKLASSLLTTVIRPIWSKKGVKKTAGNLFVSRNFYNVDPLLPLADNPKLVISEGQLPLPENLAVQRNVAVPRGVTISWTDNSDSFMASSDDLLRIVAIAGETAISVSSAGATRTAENAEIVLPFAEGQTVRIFVFFEDALQHIYSNDVNFTVEI